MSTLQDIVTSAGAAIERLILDVATQSGRVNLMARLGWLMPPGVDDLATDGDLVADVAAKLVDLTNLSDEQLKDKNLVFEKVAALLAAIGKFADAIDTLVTTFATFDSNYLTQTNIVAEFFPACSICCWPNRSRCCFRAS